MCLDLVLELYQSFLFETFDIYTSRFDRTADLKRIVCQHSRTFERDQSLMQSLQPIRFKYIMLCSKRMNCTRKPMSAHHWDFREGKAGDHKGW